MALITSPSVAYIDGKTGTLTATDVLNTIKTVDGSTSGLDADTVDGLNPDSTNTASTIVARDASGNFSAGTITATLSGNASSSTRVTYIDTRDVNFNPSTYSGISLHLKNNATDSLNDGGTYHGVLNLQQWGDLSGGVAHQLSFTDNNNIYLRNSTSTTSWGSWIKVWTDNNDGASSGLDADLLDGQHGSYYQQALVSGTNIKTINGNSILGSGNIAIDGAGVVRTITDVTPTNGQTVFTIAYTVNLIDVYINGVKLAASDFTASNGTSVTLGTSTLTTADSVQFVTWQQFSVMNGVTLDGIQTMTNKTVIGLKETAVNLTGSNIDINLGNYFYKTISGATTFTVSNVPVSGVAASFILDLTNAGSQTITWWSNVKWASGTVPTLTAAGRDILGFFTYDSGATWNGLLLAINIK